MYRLRIYTSGGCQLLPADPFLAFFEHPWIHPLLATAAHTGDRKGELLWIRVNDVDFAAGHVVIREKK